MFSNILVAGIFVLLLILNIIGVFKANNKNRILNFFVALFMITMGLFVINWENLFK